ncbi:MAG: hypothetical protein IJ764_05050 [Bacteroidales bacterium]|nr:hypothetical protein [Bacteroidales bacterium]
MIVENRQGTDDVDAFKRLEDSGAGAIILRTKFEEEFAYDIKRNTRIVARTNNYGAGYEYVAQHLGTYQMDDYFANVQKITDAVGIPVIGSISCISFEAWINYVAHYEKAGCRAIELTMSMRPYDISQTSSDIERIYNQVIFAVRRASALPIAIRMGNNFTNLAKFVQQLSWSGIQGISLFDKEVPMDIDIDNLQLNQSKTEYCSEDLCSLLRWIAILSGKTRCGLSACTGIKTASDIVKVLLAGAETVQIPSALCWRDENYLSGLHESLAHWMESHQFEKIAQFRGRLAMSPNDPAVDLMRVQAIRMAFESK